MTTKTVLTAFLAGLSAAAVSAFAEDGKNEFDEACRLFEEAAEAGSDPKARTQYVDEHLVGRVESKDVIEAYGAIYHVAPEERYKVFKSAAENALGKPWDCPALEKLMD